MAVNENFRNLLEVLCPEAKDDLMRYGIIDLVSVTVNAVPDPARPDDRLAMKISAEVLDNFRTGIPAIDRYLDMADAICSTSEDDLTLSLRDELLVTLDTQRKELAGLREGMMNGKPVAALSDPEVAALIRPSLENPVIEDHIWSIGWSVTKEEDGRLLAYCDIPFFAEYVDEDSWVRIQDRMRRVNYVIGGMVGELMGEETIRESP
ncbi:MAG TPA: hypothetical protein HA272_09080 [Methanoregula sp.]|nr:hypothetical protein [Methanoregula sp.]